MEKDKNKSDDYVLVRVGTNDINFETGEQTLDYLSLDNFHPPEKVMIQVAEFMLKQDDLDKKCSACGKLMGKKGITWMSPGVTFFGDGICYKCFINIDKNMHDIGL